jgi:rhamnosyl/mannosyltransferase
LPEKPKFMNIVHLGKYYPPAPGGIESHVQTLARGQSELGHELRVICVNHTDKQGNDVTHFRWRKTSSFTHVDGKVRVDRIGRWFSISRLEVCPNLTGWISDATSKADIVHLHTPNPLMLAAWWVAGNRKTALVVTHHSDVIKQRFLRRLLDPFESRVYGAAKLIFSDSPNYIEGSLVLQKFRQKVVVLPLGIDLEPYLNPGVTEQEETKRIKGNYGWPLWLMVGRMTYYKGYHVALEALAKTPGKLLVVGNGPLEGDLKRQAANLGVAERVVWMPSVSQSQLISLYHAATALWFPSVARSEGFGLAQVEAMACGCPVINTAIPASGVSWVSLHGESGLTGPMGDPEALSKASRRITGENGLRETLSKGAKKRAVENFNASKMALTSLELYQSR